MVLQCLGPNLIHNNEHVLFYIIFHGDQCIMSPAGQETKFNQILNFWWLSCSSHSLIGLVLAYTSGGFTFFDIKAPWDDEKLSMSKVQTLPNLEFCGLCAIALPSGPYFVP